MVRCPCHGHLVQEGLRLFPPVPAAVRVATEDMVVCGHVIPRGAWVHVSGTLLCGYACHVVDVTRLVVLMLSSNSMGNALVTSETGKNNHIDFLM